MSELDTDSIDNDDDLPQESELDALKSRAKLMGISFHPSIGLETLRDKVNAAIIKPKVVAEEAAATQANPLAGLSDVPVVVPVETPHERKVRKKREAGELIRIRITCMNPQKTDWDGEIFTVSNAVVGTFKKYVPYNNDEGWHVPRLMLNMIQMRQCQVFQEARDERGNRVKRSKLIKEFAVEIMPSLSGNELMELAQRQAMAGKIG